MQFPESWLREFCNPPLTTAELADLLTMSGLEVEGVRPLAPPCKGVVVAEVLSVSAHPNADKLRVCWVNVGASAPLQIVCGASNVRAGIKVPCAQVGAELAPPANKPNAGPLQIRLGELRGIESHGMLCSASELHLLDEANGLLILDEDAVVGADVRQHLNLDDMIFSLKLTPNLGHALSVFGLAREVAALTGSPLKALSIPQLGVDLEEILPVNIEAPNLCGRFSGRIIRGLNSKAPTPRWMVDRLLRCGQRSISALVDISNYVMFETGQPSHIFDLDKIQGGLTVRWARPGENLKLLNGQTVALDPAIGVIADQQAVESMAGIMGGGATAVSDDTCNVYIESAFWWPDAIAGRSRRFNFSTDAAHRFERGVDPEQTLVCVEQLTYWVQQVCGGQAGPISDQCPRLPVRPAVRLRVARASKVIGMPLSQAQCSGVMQRLGFSFTESLGELHVCPPSWRFDLQIEEDLIEEVIRVIGYSQLPSDPPRAPVVARVRSESTHSLHGLRHQLAHRDYSETINFSFVEKRWESELAGNDEPVRLLNPIAAPLSVMRSSLMGGLVAVLRHNLSRKLSRVRVFEVGRVFHLDVTAPDGPFSVAGLRQTMQVGGLAYGALAPTQWGHKERMVDFYDVKGDVEALLQPRVAKFKAALHPALHPGRSASIELDGEVVGFVGELHPRWRQAYDLPAAPVLFEISAAALMMRKLPVCEAIMRQQPVWRDLALMASVKLTHDSLIHVVRQAHPFVRSAVLFDIYHQVQDCVPLQQSMAVRIELNDDDIVLTENLIGEAMDQIVSAVAQLGCTLRG